MGTIKFNAGVKGGGGGNPVMTLQPNQGGVEIFLVCCKGNQEKFKPDGRQHSPLGERL